MKELILSATPVWFQNTAISSFNRYQWWIRQRGQYDPWFVRCSRAFRSPKNVWLDDQKDQLNSFLKYAIENSEHYAHCDLSKGLDGFPILEKKHLIESLDTIKTINARSGIVSHTGGTTGASMKVIYTVSDVQKRFATLDWFRSQSGWCLGKRTAWFSGKNIVREADVRNGICFRDDWLTKTRFFSTFHANEENFDIYWKALIDFDPEYIVGFPSTIGDILSIARDRKLDYPHKVSTVFPTAETVLDSHRSLFKDVLGAETKNQYASSEGSPFIVECNAGSLHILPFTGIFEVIDEHGNPAREGEVLVTAFQTHGTPLIRYRVGDRISLASEETCCACGSSFPIVERIDGRNADFVWSPEYGRINLGNLSNSTKGVPGIIAFRALQSEPNEVTVEVHGTSSFDKAAEHKFEKELRKRTGERMAIALVRVHDLERKSSGKFRIVENTLKPEEMTRATL